MKLRSSKSLKVRFTGLWKTPSNCCTSVLLPTPAKAHITEMQASLVAKGFLEPGGQEQQEPCCLVVHMAANCQPAWFR